MIFPQFQKRDVRAEFLNVATVRLLKSSSDILFLYVQQGKIIGFKKFVLFLIILPLYV